ncbi:MAG: TerC family protein [Verrucomicrobiales bacterium]
MMALTDSLLAWSWPTGTDLLNALPIILSLIIIEGLLSVDNALGIAAMANHLPGRQKAQALRWGIIGAYAFRGLALLFASFIIANPWLKIAGAAYLIYLMCRHFTQHRHVEQEGAGEAAASLAGRGFWATVASIELMDLSLSVDNVVAAVALSDEFWVVCTGVFIGILTLRLVAGFCLPLIQRFPILEQTAFILIGYVGLILVFELTTDLDVTTWQKFIGILAIIALTLWYARSRPLQKSLDPVLIALRWPMWLVDKTVGTVFALLVWPFRAAWQTWKGPHPASSE